MSFLGAISQAVLSMSKRRIVRERSFSCPSRVHEPPNSTKLLDNNYYPLDTCATDTPGPDTDRSNMAVFTELNGVVS